MPANPPPVPLAAPAAAPLALLSLGNLVVGTGAFVLAGIVGSVAADLGVGLAAAGQAMTAYALATAVLAPLLLVAASRLPRRQALVLALLVFAAGNAVSALATSLPALLAGRVLMGAGAMFTPLAAGLAVAASAPAARGRALSVVFLGISLSYVVGLPLGTGLAAHGGWRAPVWAVAVAAVAMAALVAWRVRGADAGPAASFAGAAVLLRRAEVLRPLVLTLLYITAIFSMFAYIGPVLGAWGARGAADVSLALFVTGVAGVVGTLVGGWAADRLGAVPTLRLQLAVMLATQALLPLLAGHFAAQVALLFVWGVAGFGMMPPQQSRLAAAAPAQAPLLLSLNSSMLYLGTAAGAVVGGAAAALVPLAQLAWAGLPFGAAGFVLLLQRAPAAASRDAMRS